jgi:hypothetical protein
LTKNEKKGEPMNNFRVNEVPVVKEHPTGISLRDSFFTTSREELSSNENPRK